MPKLLEIACYVLVPLAWGLAVEFVVRRIRRRRSSFADNDARGKE